MRNFVSGIVIALLLVFVVRYCEYRKDEEEQSLNSSAIIEKQLKNVGKLVVTEGNYSQVLTYEDSRKLYFDVLTSTKKALVIVNAKAQIAYDLSEIETEIDKENNILTIRSIPEPELSIFPDIEYYDIQNGYFNSFDKDDHTLIKSRIDEALRARIEASNLRSNAENRLISELQKIYILTNSLGWTLQYNGLSISMESDLEGMDF